MALPRGFRRLNALRRGIIAVRAELASDVARVVARFRLNYE